jgi:hypothetical protein
MLASRESSAAACPNGFQRAVAETGTVQTIFECSLVMNMKARSQWKRGGALKPTSHLPNPTSTHGIRDWGACRPAQGWLSGLPVSVYLRGCMSCRACCSGTRCFDLCTVSSRFFLPPVPRLPSFPLLCSRLDRLFPNVHRCRRPLLLLIPPTAGRTFPLPPCWLQLAPRAQRELVGATAE